MNVIRRPLCENHIDLAKRQAYILRDLISQHCGIELPKSQTTECLAQTFHETSWAGLQANIHPIDGEVYYAYSGVITHYLGQQLVSYLKSLGYRFDTSSAYRVILVMPAARYDSARSVEGAIITTLLAANPTWTLIGHVRGAQPSPHHYVYLVGDAEPHIPMAFSSDPVTNEERLLVVNTVTHEEECVSLSMVRFTPHDSADEHSDNPLAFYPRALNKHIAQQWLLNGGDLQVRVQNQVFSFKERFGTNDTNDIEIITREYPESEPVFFAINLGVHDPVERWCRSYVKSREILPVLQEAEKRFDVEFNQAINGDPKTVERNMGCAFEKYNSVAESAMLAYWEDTREVNSKNTIMESYCNPRKRSNQFFVNVSEFLRMID